MNNEVDAIIRDLEQRAESKSLGVSEVNLSRKLLEFLSTHAVIDKEVAVSAEIAELVDCLKDMEKGDDGHAWTVARRLIEKYGAES